MTSEKSIAVKELVLELLHQPGPVRSAHFDQIEGFLIDSKMGPNVLFYAVNVLRVARDVMQAGIGNAKVRPLAYLPLRSSETIELWSDSRWGEVGEVDEPPSLYLLSGDPFQVLSEEYRRPIPLPQMDEDKIIGIYRCFRDIEAAENSWDFGAGIYLFFSGDFE